MTSQPLVLITGASGKARKNRSVYSDIKRVDVVPIEDVATGDFTEFLKGVGAVIHIASPLSGRQDTAGMMRSAVDGTLNVVRQAAAAGVKKIIVTASLAAHGFLYEEIITPNDWNDATVDQVLDGSHDSSTFWIYHDGAVKTIAEQKLWEFSEQHPDIDVTTILPPMVYGPVLPGAKIESKTALRDYSTIGRHFYKNILPDEGSAAKLKPIQDAFPLTVDVRDVAKAHVLALAAPLSSEVGRKRLLVAGEPFLWKDAVEHLLTVRPELHNRLPDPGEAKKLKTFVMDVSRAREVLGMVTFVDWRKTVVDSVDSILNLENGWEIA